MEFPHILCQLGIHTANDVSNASILLPPSFLPDHSHPRVYPVHDSVSVKRARRRDYEHYVLGELFKIDHENSVHLGINLDSRPRSSSCDFNRFHLSLCPLLSFFCVCYSVDKYCYIASQQANIEQTIVDHQHRELNEDALHGL